MTPADIESFVNASPTRLVMTLPEVGYVSSGVLAFYAVATPDKLAVFTGKESGPDTFVYSGVSRNGDVVSLKTVRPFPAPTVLLVRADAKDTAEWTDGVDATLSEYDDDVKKLRAAAEDALNDTLVWEQPTLTTQIMLVEWADLEDGDVYPKGVLYFPKGSNKLAVRTFPGYEGEADRWSSYTGEVTNPEAVLNGLRVEAGRSTLLSDVRYVDGTNEDDAAARGLFQFAARAFAEHDRRLY